MKIRHTIYISCLIIVLSSCEGIVGGNGYVFDSKNKTPLSGVRVILYLNDKAIDTSYSDRNGFFRGRRFVGCVPNCPCAKIILSKNNFKALIIDYEEYWKKNNPSPALRDSMMLYLVRQ